MNGRNIYPWAENNLNQGGKNQVLLPPDGAELLENWNEFLSDLDAFPFYQSFFPSEILEGILKWSMIIFDSANLKCREWGANMMQILENIIFFKKNYPQESGRGQEIEP